MVCCCPMEVRAFVDEEVRGTAIVSSIENDGVIKGSLQLARHVRWKSCWILIGNIDLIEKEVDEIIYKNDMYSKLKMNY